ncbi:hypothetical protein IVZ55_27350 [Salmonella enterica subsp. enterica serovar Worthington]|nr:hypothetical protein [Salmonella enterica subsp. enterica serovar Worthington]
MSADISPLLVHTPAAARPLWLRLRRSSPFTLTVLMCCLRCCGSARLSGC